MAVRLTLMLFVSLFLAACNGASLQTIWKLRNLGIGTLDPSQVRIAINAPGWMAPMFDDLQLAGHLQPSGREAIAGVFRLRRIDLTDDVAAIQRVGLAVDNPTIFEIDQQDLKQVRQFQKDLVTSKDVGIFDSVSFRLQRRTRAACLSFPPAGAPTTVDIYLHPTAEIGWVLIEANVDIREFDLASSVPPPDEAACRNFPGNDPGVKGGVNQAQAAGEKAEKSSKKLDGGVRFHTGK